MISEASSREKRKLLMVLNELDVGGVQIGVTNMAYLLHEKKSNIQMDALILTDIVGGNEEKFCRYAGNIYRIPVTDGSNKIASVIKKYYNALYLCKKVYGFLKEHSYDVIHVKSRAYAAPILAAAKKAGIKNLVVQCHVDKKEGVNLVTGFYNYLCAKTLNKIATCRLGVSESALENAYGSPKIGRVIQNPNIDLTKFDPKLYGDQRDPEIIQLIEVGTYSERKNQRFSVELIKELAEKGYNAHLYLVGYALNEESQAYYDSVVADVQKYGISDRVKFLDKDSNIPELLSQCDGMLLPSLREGLPNVILEAQCMGVPCLVSDTIGRECDCGLATFYDLKDKESWIRGIADIAHKERRYVDMSRWNNRDVINEYIKIWETDN